MESSSLYTVFEYTSTDKNVGNGVFEEKVNYLSSFEFESVVEGREGIEEWVGAFFKNMSLGEAGGVLSRLNYETINN